MSTNSAASLPWRIEAFREYLTFEVLQAAAAVFAIYEGERFDPRNPRIIEMQLLLVERTQKEAWIPKRAGSEDVDWNVEGDVTRNKGRVFTSMLILHPKEWADGEVRLTEFGHALASGRVTKSKFYDFIISRFKYPHPAWEDNWAEWRSAGRVLYPFIYLLQTLLSLHGQSPDNAYLTVDEVADYLHPIPDHGMVDAYASAIIKSRQEGRPATTKRSDKIHRKIGDLLGFLCLSPYCFYKGTAVHLNLIDTHSVELTHFWGSRNSQDKLNRIIALIQKVMSRLAN